MFKRFDLPQFIREELVWYVGIAFAVLAMIIVLRWFTVSPSEIW
jgi:hypothetical protein